MELFCKMENGGKTFFTPRRHPLRGSSLRGSSLFYFRVLFRKKPRVRLLHPLSFILHHSPIPIPDFRITNNDSQLFCYVLLSRKPQLGQVASPGWTTKPQLGQVLGWERPKGAPQAIQPPSPTGLAVPQYSQVMRFNLSES